MGKIFKFDYGDRIIVILKHVSVSVMIVRLIALLCYLSGMRRGNFSMQVHFQNRLATSSDYEGHRVSVKVTEACLCILFAGGLPSIERQSCLIFSSAG